MALIKTTPLSLASGIVVDTGDTSNHEGIDVAAYYNIGLDFTYTIGAGATGTTYLKMYSCQNSNYSTNQKFHLMTMKFATNETAKHFSLPCLDFRNFVIKVVNNTDSSITFNAEIVGARVS